MIELAYAAEQASRAQVGRGFVDMIFILGLMLAIFYFILIRPQQKKQRQHQDMLKALKTGDQIVTIGGIYGTIIDIDEQKVKIKIADNVKIELARGSIQSRLGWEGEKKKEGS
jgi:preprotein translocase subunit YajC